ncbi:MAG TPA: OmpH family outer membrane protein [Oligoflexia bacterium]|nr:OmpH family outer membrane protein [Oligoflexia bacterium]
MKIRISDRATGLLAAAAVIFISLPALVFVAPAWAAPEVRIGVVDMQRVLASSKEGVKAQKSYETEVKKAQEEVDKKKSEYETLKKSFDKQRDSLNDSARTQKEEELISMEKEVTRSFQDAKEQLRRKNMTIVSDLVKTIRKVVEKIGENDGYTLVLEKSAQGVLFAAESTDITEKVIEQYNSKGGK